MRRSRTDIPRLLVIATLVLAGLRIVELCGLRVGHLDFARGVLVVSRDITKTDAGERTIPMLPALRELLLEHVMELGVTPDQPVFGDRHGPSQHDRQRAPHRRRPVQGRRQCPARLHQGSGRRFERRERARPGRSGH